MEIGIKGKVIEVNKKSETYKVPDLVYTYIDGRSKTEYFTDGSIIITHVDKDGLKLYRMYQSRNGKIERTA